MAVAPSKTDELLVEQHGRVCVITLNRPERLNAISRDMLEELSAKTEPLIETHLVLQQHGRTICRNTRPACGQCPVQRDCPGSTVPQS